MNAVERLWRALSAREWKRAEAQMHPRAVIDLPISGQRFAGRHEYVLHHAASAEQRMVHVELVVHEVKHVAVRLTITIGQEVEHGAGFYELQDGRIARGTELWGEAPVDR
jgi:hypothetical protein